MSKPTSSITCPKCNGTGHRPLSQPYLDCLAAIRKLKCPTLPEVHRHSGGSFLPTATNKRVMRLAQAGVVRIIPGRPQRVELVNG